jgi:nucleotide-binding universal stress UspA family protein
METLYKHILVPLDFTEQNDRALSIAKQLCRPGVSRVTLLHVIETIDYVAARSWKIWRLAFGSTELKSKERSFSANGLVEP